MINILVINPGSKTLKFKLIGYVEDVSKKWEELVVGKIDDKNGSLMLQIDNQSDIPVNSFDQSAKVIQDLLWNYKIDKIAFRIVHGGEFFTTPALLDAKAIKKLEQVSNLAPLHNPIALKYIKQFSNTFVNCPIYGVFDTAFHQSILPVQYLYALPYEYYQDYKIRRYGFHGISHQYVSEELLKLEPSAHRIISCHLGSGSSICAIIDGKSFDTSMGFTPLEGLMMTTRAGDVDDGAIDYIQKKTGMSDTQIMDLINNKSGLLGVSGISFDMRTLLEAEANGNERAHLAIEMYIYKVIKYIGAYCAAMKDCDALILTAGIGAGSDIIRKRIIDYLGYLNFKIDQNKNNGQINVAVNLKISQNDSKPIWIIPTNEEIKIAQEIC